MLILWITIPLMVLGVAMATVPVILQSLREHRARYEGRRLTEPNTAPVQRYDARGWPWRRAGHDDERERRAS